MKKILIMIAFLQIVYRMEVIAQVIKPKSPDSTGKNNDFVIYVNQPFGMSQKIRAKVGYRNDNDETYLISYTDYHYNSVLPFFGTYNIKGFQSYFEYQKCTVKRKKANFSYYAKIGYGEFRSETKADFLSISKSSGVASGSYVLIGVGFAEEFYIDSKNRLSIQLTEGLKYCQSFDVKGNHHPGAFNFIFSPGSILDININLGYKF